MLQPLLLRDVSQDVREQRSRQAQAVGLQGRWERVVVKCVREPVVDVSQVSSSAELLASLAVTSKHPAEPATCQAVLE